MTQPSPKPKPIHAAAQPLREAADAVELLDTLLASRPRVVHTQPERES